MKEKEKIRLSDNYSTIKIVCFLGLFLSILCLIEYKGMNFQEVIEYTILVLVLSILLCYFFTRKDVYFDDLNLYVIESKKNKYLLELKKIKQVDFETSSFGYRGHVYTIMYIDCKNQTKELKINSNRYFNQVSLFLNYTKQANPNLIIKNWGLQ